jgi:hypothetical protein
MDRGRYQGYVAAREALAVEACGEPAANVLEDLAEGLLLARDHVEAETARERVPEALSLLVDGDDLTRGAADRFWVQLKACGPPMSWPPSWDRSAVTRPRGVVRGR